MLTHTNTMYITQRNRGTPRKESSQDKPTLWSMNKGKDTENICFSLSFLIQVDWLCYLNSITLWGAQEEAKNHFWNLFSVFITIVGTIKAYIVNRWSNCTGNHSLDFTLDNWERLLKHWVNASIYVTTFGIPGNHYHDFWTYQTTEWLPNWFQISVLNCMLTKLNRSSFYVKLQTAVLNFFDLTTFFQS